MSFQLAFGFFSSCHITTIVISLFRKKRVEGEEEKKALKNISVMYWKWNNDDDDDVGEEKRKQHSRFLILKVRWISLCWDGLDFNSAIRGLSARRGLYVCTRDISLFPTHHITSAAPSASFKSLRRVYMPLFSVSIYIIFLVISTRLANGVNYPTRAEKKIEKKKMWIVIDLWAFFIVV